MAERPLATPAVRIGPRTAIVLVLASAAGLVMFCWPLVAAVAPSTLPHATDAPFVFLAVLPVLVAVVLADLIEGGVDAKALALLGVLSAINAALRPLGGGIAGIETVFFLLVLAGRVFGPGFGFVLGCTSLFASALLTAGVGPWLPFQMLASAWIGLGAGLLPRAVRGRAEIAMLAGYGVVAAYAFGFLLNLYLWPFALGPATELSYDPALSLGANLHRFVAYTVATSALGWDTGRALTNAVAIVALGPAVLAVLRRTVRRASFGAEVTYAGVGDDRSPDRDTERAAIDA